MSTFDKVSGQYQQKALVQQAAAEKLLALLKIGEQDDVLDVACGPRHITQRIKILTQGRVVGTDISNGMIEQPRANIPLSLSDTRRRRAWTTGRSLVFCNSSFQWSRDN